MRTFTGRFVARLKLLGVIAVYAGCPGFFFLLPLLSGRVHANATTLWCLAIVLPIFFLPVLYSLFGLLDTVSVYELDDDGITKRRLGRETRLRWQDLNRFELSDKKNTLTLTDNQAQRVKIVLGSHVTGYGFRDTNGKLLADALNERLQPLQAQMRQSARQGQTFRHPVNSPAGSLGIVMPVVGLLMAAFIRFGPMFQPTSAGSAGSAADNTVIVGLSGFFVFSALCLLAMGLPILLSVWTVTDTAITRQTPWKTVTIPFDHIHVFAVRAVKQGLERVTLQGDGKTIMFTSLLPNYGLLMDFVRARVPSEALNAQASANAEMERKEARSMAWQMPIVGMILGFLIGLLGWMFLQDGRERLETYRLLEAQGQTTMARVTDTHTKGRNEPRYSVDYTFVLAGKHYDGSSYVTGGAYAQAQQSGGIPVVYLPSNPAIQHAVASTGKTQAREMIPIGRGMLSIAVSLPFLFGLGSLLAYKRKYTSPAAMRRLEQIETP